MYFYVIDFVRCNTTDKQDNNKDLLTIYVQMNIQ